MLPAPEVEALIERLTAADPRERLASARDALALLKSALADALRATEPLATAATTPISREIEINGRRLLGIAAALVQRP